MVMESKLWYLSIKKKASFLPPREGMCAFVPVLLADRVNVDTWAADCTSAWNTELLCTPWLGRSQAVRGTCDWTINMDKKAQKSTSVQYVKQEITGRENMTNIASYASYLWDIGLFHFLVHYTKHTIFPLQTYEQTNHVRNGAYVWWLAGRRVTLHTRYFLFIWPQCVTSTFKPFKKKTQENIVRECEGALSLYLLTVLVRNAVCCSSTGVLRP